MSDERELVAKILAGDFQAFTRLVSDYEKLVFFVVSRMVQELEDKEDICQEVFLKVHRSLPAFKFESKLSTWIARIAYLTAVDHLKKSRLNRKHDPVKDDDFHFTTDDPAQLLDEKQRTAWLNRLIAELPDKYRIVITLYHLNECSLQEIQEITGIPQGTIKSHLFRARQILKDQIKEHFN
jgi:RNA polymerase sigma factor (sigma-70 family)